MSQIKLKHSGGNSVIIAAPDSNPASDVTLKLPQADGSANEFLKTDGSGNLAFAAAGGGITEADSWRLTTAYEGGASDLTANWERSDDYASHIGTGMTESSGVFTFPSTGVYYLSATTMANADNARTYVGLAIKDNASGTAIAEGYDSISASNYYTNITCSCFYDVTDTSTRKILLRVETTSTTEWKGSSTRDLTSIKFIRLGDT